ncbi:MAG: penicillin-binding protein 2 [Holosporales bacterium]|jgi:penicillin-binding protein 2|nr:penicillin-binding protein 2 [Holosporales bacterium]
METNYQDKDPRLFPKRVFICFGVIALIFILLVGRLFFLQVINNDKYKLLSDKNRIYTTYSAAPRGTIFDRKGRILATSRLSYRAAIDLNQYKHSSWNIVCEKLSLDKSIPFSTYVNKQVHDVGPTSVIPIKEQLTWNEILEIETLSSQITGVVVLPKIIRVYPHRAACCHFVGYVTQPNQNDIKQNANLKVLDACLGKMGIERACDSELQGQIGIKQVEVNAARHMIRLIDEKKPVKGRDIHLTIDMDLQMDVMDIMKDVRCGATIVMDINTGEILASVSVPAFDPNVFAKTITQQEWQELLGNKDLPLINRSVSGMYAPGSTFKPIVALAALNNDTVSRKTTFFCPGYYEVNKHRFHCHRWRYGGHGSFDIIKAMEQSCDVFFYNVAVKLGGESIIEAAKDFGFGVLTNIELPEEKKGEIPPSKRVWQKRDIGQVINLAIGQGHLSATPLQLVVMTARIASGKRVYPHIIGSPSLGSEVGSPTLGSESNMLNVDAEAMDYSKAAFNIVREGLASVVQKGTALTIRNNNLSIAGKTGSTQVCRITKEERARGKQIERPYHLKDHALFIGYAPVECPRFAVVVVVEHGESGGRAAAPIGGKALAAAVARIK